MQLVTDDKLTIGEVARRAGLRSSAIRYYERLGLLPKPARVSGQRRYGDDVFRRLALIDVARQAGFTLQEVRTLIHEFSPDAPPSKRWRSLARRKLPEIEHLIAQAHTMKRVLERALQSKRVSLEESGFTELRGHGAEARTTSGVNSSQRLR